jgi:hypothetical protein
MRSKIWKTLIGGAVAAGSLFAAAVTAPVSGAAVRINMSAPASSAPSGNGELPNNALSSAGAGMVPPQNPSTSLAASPNFLGDGNCKESVLDDSLACNTDALKSIDNGRTKLESMAPLSLNLTAFEAMTVPEQIFVITDLERTDRGLAPIAGLTTQLDDVAQTGAADNDDPHLSSSTLTGGASVTSWGSIWAGGTANPVGSDYFFMYDDGPNSPNSDCSTPSSSACWGHRDVILGTFTSTGCTQPEQYMGAGYTASGSSYGPAFAGIVVGACGATPSDVVFTWAQAQQEMSGGSGASVPGTPLDLTASSSPQGVVLTWQAPASNGGASITGYQIYRSRAAGAEKLYITVACTTSSCRYTNKHARPKRMFFYTVAAVNGVGTGPTSPEVSAEAR